MAREVLLSDPDLVNRPIILKEIITKRLKQSNKQAFYYHQYSSEDYPNEGPEDRGLPSQYSPTRRYPKFDEDHPATKMNDIHTTHGGPGSIPSIEKVRDRFAARQSKNR